VRNPDAIRHECADCGATTKVNTRTGRLYSHQAPEEIAACSASGEVVAPPQGGEPLLLPPLEAVQKPAVPEPPRRVVDGPSGSVRTVSGGLPGLGKRR
jgi:ribosomal protein S27E